jgi:pimeloyl-ACP methyl ester carboxylesterase
VKASAVAIAGCAIAIAVAGCGGSGHPASSTSSSTGTAGAGTSGERAARLLAAAEAALDRVHSFHLRATSTIATLKVSVAGDVVLPGKISVVVRDGASVIELRAIGSSVYFRANRAYLASTGSTGAALAELSGHWASTTAAQLPTVGDLAALASPTTLGLCLLGQRLGTLSVGAPSSVAGRRAIVLIDAGDRPGSAPGRLYLAASGPPLPLRLTSTGPSRPGGSADPACHQPSSASSTVVTGSDEFITDVNAPIRISAPAGAASIESLTSPHATSGVAAAAVRTAQTKLGKVGYRIVGSGSPVVLITGFGGTMESWDPRFVDALAAHHRVVIFDNAGIGGTSALPGTLTIDAMADQTGALIDTLGLGKPAVIGWSMGGMIAEALAIRHPGQVSRLVLCATFPGAGTIVQPTQSAIDALTKGSSQQGLADLFPASQAAAQDAFLAAVATYPAAPSPSAATLTAQEHAIIEWWTGADPAGKLTAKISVPTLVADGTIDRLDPVANSHALAGLIRGARLVLYPGSGHAFLFANESAFLPLVASFLG